MPDNTDDTKNKGKGNESNSDTKTNTQSQTPFDPKTLSNEDFSKIFEDPRIWEHKRFKELNDDAKAGKKALEKLEKLEEDKLKEEGKFKELADKEKARAEEALKQLQTEKVNNALLAEATKAGAVDLEAVKVLVDRNAIQVGEDGSITGVAEAVKGLLESKPYLKNANAPTTPNIGSGTAPTNTDTGIKKFTLTQIQDPKFYQEHKEEIGQAYKTGNVIDDTAQAHAPGAMQPQG